MSQAITLNEPQTFDISSANPVSGCSVQLNYTVQSGSGLSWMTPSVDLSTLTATSTPSSSDDNPSGIGNVLIVVTNPSDGEEFEPPVPNQIQIQVTF